MSGVNCSAPELERRAPARSRWPAASSPRRARPPAARGRRAPARRACPRAPRRGRRRPCAPRPRRGRATPSRASLLVRFGAHERGRERVDVLDPRRRQRIRPASSIGPKRRPAAHSATSVVSASAEQHPLHVASGGRRARARRRSRGRSPGTRPGLRAPPASVEPEHRVVGLVERTIVQRRRVGEQRHAAARPTAP